MNSNLEQRRAQHRQALKQGLEQAVARLSRLPEVERVILFGSYRRGRRDLFTDLDLLVVIDSADNPVTRTARLYRHLGGAIKVDFDLVTFSPQEFKQNQKSSFLKRVLGEGEIIYERSK